MQKKPLVSAIVSTYNSEKFIRGKIEDLLGQTIIEKMEIIIVNSGSQQNEHEIIKEYLDKYNNIKYIRTEERETIYKAWNRGIKIAEGEFITNANTDDRLRKDAYEILSKALNENPDVALVYADQYVTNEPNKPFADVNKKKIERLPDFNYVVQLDRCIVYSQPMWRASLHFEDNIWFDENLEICGDHKFELQISLKYRMLHLNEALGTFYLDDKKNNKSHINLELVAKEMHSFTTSYMRTYLQMLSHAEKEKLLKKFFIYTKIPIPIFLVLIKAKLFFPHKKHVFLLEFTYLFTSLILEYLNRYEDAINVCHKFLNRRKSERIKEQLQNLNNIKKTD